MSKWTALIVILIYAAGFLVVSLNYASFGFLELNPFKPRIVAAGIWFFVLLATAIMASIKLCPSDRDFPGKILDALWLYWIFYFAALTVGPKLFDFGEQKLKMGRHEFSSDIIIFLLGVIIPLTCLAGRHWKAEHPRAVVLLGMSVIAMILGWLVISLDKTFSPAELAFTLSFAGYLSGFYFRALRQHSTNEIQWIYSITFLFSTVAGFGTSVYPNIKASWGGGSLVPVVVYLSKDSRVLPNGQLTCFLLDESDGGIFVTKGKREHALFLPKDAVASIFYSDKPLTSEYFQSSSSAGGTPAVPPTKP